MDDDSIHNYVRMDDDGNIILPDKPKETIGDLMEEDHEEPEHESIDFTNIFVSFTRKTLGNEDLSYADCIFSWILVMVFLAFVLYCQTIG